MRYRYLIAALLVGASVVALAQRPTVEPIAQPVVEPQLAPDGEATQYYALTTQVVGTGTIAKSPDLATYAHGSSVSCTATGDVDNRFTGWSNAATGSTNPVSILMNAAKTLVATFTPQWDIAVTTVGTGTVTSNPTGSPAWTYDDGTAVTLTATPGTGWAGPTWTGDTTGTATPLLFAALHADKAVTATFLRQFYGLSFDGGDRTDGGATSPIHGLTNYTVEALIYLDSYTSGAPNAIGLDASNAVFSLNVNSTTTMRWRPLGFSSEARVTAPGAETIPGKWLYIVITHAAGGANNILAYYNGAQWGTFIASPTGNPTATPTAGTVFRLGASAAATPAAFWPGDIGFVRVWNRVLLQAEWETAMSNPWYTASGIVCHYAMTPGSGDALTDIVGTYGMTLPDAPAKPTWLGPYTTVTNGVPGN